MKLTRRTTVRLLAGSALAAIGSHAFGATPTKIAIIGEQTVHSLHRENDPEVPQLLGEILDADFRVDPAPHPTGGGMLYGGGSKYRIGNFGHPRGTVIDHALENPRAILRSDELKLAEKFAPDILVLGPFGDHEPLTKVALSRFESDLRRLVDRITAFRPRPKLYLALPLPRGPRDEDGNYRHVRDATRRVAKARGLAVVDLWTPFIGRPEYFQDLSHLTVAGRKHMAQIVARTVPPRP